MIIFGKALGNGYAINSILGRDAIMKSSEKTFISSTFWSERIGLTAGLKTLEVMKNIESWKIIKSKGILIKKKWKDIFTKYGIDATISGIDPLPSFNFLSNNKS